MLRTEKTRAHWISDQAETRFGIREVKSEVLAANRRLFSVNGKNILIRGGGWSPDMMLRENQQRERDELRYVQDMGLNTVRLEGKLETKNFSIWRTRAAFCSSPAGAAAIIGSIGPTGSRRISPSRNSRCGIRCIGCAVIPAWSRG